MDRLWTPWRFDYIRGLDREAGDCVFCTILAQNADDENFVLHRGTHAYVILNLFPYTAGHLLIAANRHIPFLRDADTNELGELMELARRCEAALSCEYSPDGFNLGFNLGRAAGAGVEHHLHMHLVPRWVGDANFVSVVAETRVLPEELPRTYARLKAYFSP
ncbi:MAG: HIT domain-containing protein [Acidobacteria bacterium]|nr:HIT domain-containing protein [Acidobacteriota bacterium]